MIDDNMKRSIYYLLEMIDERGTIVSELQWKDVREQFDLVFPDFFRALRAAGVVPSAKEERVLMLTKLNYTISEIAYIMQVKESSVHTANYRFRKKYGLAADQPFKIIIEQLVA